MTVTETDDDFALLDAWRAGDRSAGERLFARHFRRLYLFFSNKVSVDPSDLIQDTLRACVEGRDRIRRESTFRAYLLGVARFQLYAHYRRARPERPLDPSRESALALSATPSRVLARRREQRWLLAALRRIPLELQVVLELHYWEELSAAELSRVLEIPTGTVKSRLRRARAALAEQIDQVCREDDPRASLSGDLDRWARSIRAEVAVRRGRAEDDS